MCVCSTVSVIVKFPEDTYVQEGEGVLFYVKVTGVPHPNIMWYNNGVEVMEDSEDGALIMPSAESKHSGVYKLVVHNTAGRVEREVRLIVEEENQSKPLSIALSTSIPVSKFGDHVEKYHKRSNKGFQDEYQVILRLGLTCVYTNFGPFSHCMMVRTRLFR